LHWGSVGFLVADIVLVMGILFFLWWFGLAVSVWTDLNGYWISSPDQLLNTIMHYLSLCCRLSLVGYLISDKAPPLVSPVVVLLKTLMASVIVLAYACWPGLVIPAHPCPLCCCCCDSCAGVVIPV
jgi:hypothetical protein